MLDQKRLQLLVSTAESMNLQPTVITDYGLVSIVINDKTRYLFHKGSNPNEQIASWLSQNKHAARVIFERNGLPNIPFCLPHGSVDAKDFLRKHEQIIIKPIRGKKSQDVHLIHTEHELAAVDATGYILEKYVKGQEVRILVVDSVVEAVHHKVYKSAINDPSTVKRVSIEKTHWDKKLTQLAIKAAQVIGLRFAAVDFLVTSDGAAYILEINSAPGIERFQAPDQGPAIDMMRLYLEQIVKKYA